MSPIYWSQNALKFDDWQKNYLADAWFIQVPCLSVCGSNAETFNHYVNELN